jgi:hypothetical protein
MVARMNEPVDVHMVLAIIALVVSIMAFLVALASTKWGNAHIAGSIMAESMLILLILAFVGTILFFVFRLILLLFFWPKTQWERNVNMNEDQANQMIDLLNQINSAIAQLVTLDNIIAQKMNELVAVMESR